MRPGPKNVRGRSREGRDYIVAAPHFNEGEKLFRAVWPQARCQFEVIPSSGAGSTA
jgi:hypothetical protein